MRRRTYLQKPVAVDDSLLHTTKETEVVRSLQYNRLRYKVPEVKDMAVVLVFFNPADSLRIVQNLYYTKALLDMAEIPVYVGELAFDDQPFVLPASPTVFQYQSSSIMFYKENLISIVEKQIPAQYTKIAIIDCDIVFKDPEWYEKASAALDTYTAVQPFTTAQRLTHTFQLEREGTGVAASGGTGFHSGFAWAFQRAWFQTVGIFEYAVIGGGDTVLVSRLYDRPIPDMIKVCEAEYNNWSKYPNISVGNTDSTLCHLPHGLRADRNYTNRQRVLMNQIEALHVETLSDLLERREDGLLEWKPVYRTEMNMLLMQYFINRQDDRV